jgi:hypothetical protein
MSLSKLSLCENNDVIYKLFPPRESLVSDIPAGDGNIGNLFYFAFTLESTHFIFNKCPIYAHDGASAKCSIAQVEKKRITVW